MKRGQGSFEYVLLLAGILLIVVLAMVLLRGGPLGSAGASMSEGTCKNALARSSQCYTSTNVWNATGFIAFVTGGPCDYAGIPSQTSCATGAYGSTGTDVCCGPQP